MIPNDMICTPPFKIVEATGGEMHPWLVVDYCGRIIAQWETRQQAEKTKKEFEAAFPIADNVNHPKHYTSHPSGVECITVTQHMNFCLGNAIKYIWRADDKGDPIENLEKAKWYIEQEIKRRKADGPGAETVPE